MTYFRKQKILLILFSVAAMCLVMVAFFAPTTTTATESMPNAELVQDAYVRTGNPNDSFADEKGLYVGHWGFNNRNRQRTLLQFSINDSQLNEVKSTLAITVTSATLTLSIWNTSLENEKLGIRVQRLLGNWDSNVTWNQLEDSAQSPNVSVSGPTVEFLTDEERWGQVSVDITAVLQSWVSERQFNTPFSLLLSAADEEIDNRFRAFVSQDCRDIECQGLEPSLIFEYDVEPTPTPTHTPTATPTPIPTHTPTPLPIQVIVDADWQRLPEPAETLQFYPRDKITVTLKAQNGPNELREAVLTGKIPPDFKVVDDSISEGGVLDDTADRPVISWRPTDPLKANAKLIETYVLERLSTEIGSIMVEPADASEHKINTKITFTIENPPDETGYCYKWKFVDSESNSVSYQLAEKPSLEYVYQKIGTFSVQVLITNSNDYYAFLEETIDIKDDAAATDMQDDPVGDSCTISGKRNILIEAEIKGIRVDDNINVAGSTGDYILPSEQHYMPMMDN